MTNNQLDFVTYCIGLLALHLNMPLSEIYYKLKSSDILSNYIITGYDVLHTFSKDYLINDISTFMREKGVLS